jgi:polyisoprenoid-binding protein YceI
MKTIRLSSIALLLLLVVANTGFTQSIKYTVSEGTKMTVSGTSTLHDWTSEVNEVNGFIAVENNFSGDGQIEKGEKIDEVNIIVPVKSIISPRGATMDKKTYNALKSEEHPEIKFELKENEVISVDSDGFTVNASGDLTIAGVTKQVSFPVEGKLVDASKMLFSGAYKLNMTEYDMEPPSAMFGQIVTGEEVEIKFDLVVNR